jgi:hypothetical protein
MYSLSDGKCIRHKPLSISHQFGRAIKNFFFVPCFFVFLSAYSSLSFLSLLQCVARFIVMCVSLQFPQTQLRSLQLAPRCWVYRSARTVGGSAGAVCLSQSRSWTGHSHASNNICHFHHELVSLLLCCQINFSGVHQCRLAWTRDSSWLGFSVTVKSLQPLRCPATQHNTEDSC